MPQDDYLKYWRVIRYYTQRKYNLKTAELDMLLFLRSERYFTKQKFKEFNTLLSWDDKRFYKLMKEGWIERFSWKKKRHTTIYKVTNKSQSMMTIMYRQLNGDELPVVADVNPLFRKNVKYTDKVYRNMIKNMNKIIRQQRHLSRE